MSDHMLERYELIVFDADGTLRRTVVPDQPCPRAAGEWVLMPGVREVLGRVRWDRPGAPHIGLASNQDQVGYGHLSLDAARDLLRDVAREATGTAPPDQALQLCPHVPDDRCECRKPEPAMLQRIMAFYGVSPDRTAFVGNDEADRRAALRAGVAFIWAERLFGNGQA